jgi:hypothetical protein
MTDATRERALEGALFHLYEQWRNLGYRAERFRQMVVPGCKRYKGGVAAVRGLVYGRPAAGFAFLREKRRLDLSVENLILQQEWADLFSDRDRLAACQKLRKHSK